MLFPVLYSVILSLNPSALSRHTNPMGYLSPVYYVLSRVSAALRRKQMRKNGVDPCTVKFYSVSDETLSTPSIGNVHGVRNLYRDARNTDDVNEIEKKLSSLESAAATVIRNLHAVLSDSSTSDSPVFTISREETETLRKFLFIMHFRNERLAKSFFDPEHPDNLLGRKRMLYMQKKLGLGSSTDMWLHFLRYYLDTPHTQILRHAAESMKSLPPNFGIGQNVELDPDVDHFEAVIYQQQAGMYYLGIWRASPGQEFVLGHNSFGLWEGKCGPSAELHKIFIISPQIAIILRLNALRPGAGGEGLRNMCRSEFVDFPLPGARPVYASGLAGLNVGEIKATDAAGPAAMAGILSNFTSQHNPRDMFGFPITSLTPDQTHVVNSILLFNVRRTGSVTFLSETSMLETALRYEADFRNGLHREDGKVKGLIHHLEQRRAADDEQTFVLEHYLEKWSRRQEEVI